MSASDRDTPATKAPEAPEAVAADKTPAETAEKVAEKAAVRVAVKVAEKAADETSETSEADELDEVAGDHEADEAEGDDEADEADEVRTAGLTPKQARRLRVAAASVLLVAMAVVLVIRLASRTSVLVVGVYGLAMILCGIVIELSRNGRTRLGTWLLVGGLVSALALDWLVLP
ncbi:hypothetical protein OG462_14245 [Streptomyces sp. NBC_01077]|uniref:hypothetical protein n=1 Tax=Streptomyces sp. NBC_01077 TaxID=2903746 RepID=UPI003866A24E|nr:hypothetical protein OG462_14245 [Streptomyces sp. NBC_01077]